MTMRLYTFQPRLVYELLCKDRAFHSRPLLDPKSTLLFSSTLSNLGNFKFRLAYDWACEQMERRDLIRPADDVFPVWSYQQWYHASHPWPDLRSGEAKRMASEERQVLLTLEVPDHEVMRLDYCYWICCLSYSYVGRVKDAKAFDRRVRKAGLRSFADNPHPEPFHSELLASWETVLDVDGCRKLWNGSREKQTIQAVFWTLRAEHVISAVEYGMGRRKEQLPKP